MLLSFLTGTSVSGELRSPSRSEATMRTIAEKEYKFLVRVASEAGKDLHSAGLSSASMVEQMADGGMGSLRFVDTAVECSNRRFGKIFVQGEFNDEDGVPVSFTVNLDDDGKIIELDLWRVDFSPLKRLPTQSDGVRIIADTE